jgi:hypothetical protein
MAGTEFLRESKSQGPTCSPSRTVVNNVNTNPVSFIMPFLANPPNPVHRSLESEFRKLRVAVTWIVAETKEKN